MYVELSVSIQPNWAEAAMNAFSNPVPASAQISGVKMAEIILMKRLRRLPLGASSAGSEASPLPPNLEIVPMAAKTSGTSLPTTTWN